MWQIGPKLLRGKTLLSSIIESYSRTQSPLDRSYGASANPTALSIYCFPIEVMAFYYGDPIGVWDGRQSRSLARDLGAHGVEDARNVGGSPWIRYRPPDRAD